MYLFTSFAGEIEEFSPAKFRGALSIMLTDSFGPNCLESCGGVIDPKAESVVMKVDEKTVEIDLKYLVSR